jgi:hypothetical protein
MIRKTKDFPANGDHNEPSTEYEIGYGRPPAYGRFKPGQSGNPKGTRKRRRNVRTVLEEALDQKIRIRERDRSRSVSKLDAIVLMVMNKALQGDAKALTNFIGLLRSVGLTSEIPEPNNAEPLTSHDDEIITDFLRRHERSFEGSVSDDIVDKGHRREDEDGAS